MKINLLLFFLLFTFISVAQNPNDCVNAITICGDSSLGIDPTGIGFDEFSLPGNVQPPCYFFDQNTIWFKFVIEESGTFMFDLIPQNGVDDYDFAIFGPEVTCETLGSSIRCSSTNPEQAQVPAATGLNLEEIDVEEGPGEDGNGYLRYIDAQVGDIYYLLVDRAVGSGPFNLFYTGDAGLPNPVIANQAENLSQCDTDGDPNESTEFNLEQNTATIIGSQINVSVTYHSTLNDASIGVNPLISPYTNISNPQTIFARIERNNGCNDVTSFTIEIGNPNVNNPEDVVLCSYNTSESYILNTIIPEIIQDSEGYIFSFHNSSNDANNNINPIGPAIDFTQTITTIYVRVTDENDPLCYSVAFFNGYINLIQLATQPEDIVVCDDDFDERVLLDLSEKNVEILGGLPPENFQVLYYSSEIDRLNNINNILGDFENTSNPQTIYSTLYETATDCFDYTQFNIVVNALPVPEFEKESYYYCLNLVEPIPITVQDKFQYYVWSTGEEGANLNTIFVDEPGTFTVTVKNEFNCENSVSVEVFPSETATITDIIVTDFNGFNNTIEIIVQGLGDYEFALNNTFYFQESNIFSRLLNNYYTVYVRDKNGCGTVSQEVLILDYPPFFTPNADGYHDTWKIIGLEEFPSAKVYIFDRYGKLLKQVEPDSKGWDGTNNNGNPLPSSDYWFSVDIENRSTIRGHFTLKR